ncbi:MAG: hypothetical protein DMF55_11075 [Acidobacteria bacterium]|nr:MAG: hypothetical protein DMF55_11075 [Acidobacteriota bacterium]
MRRSEGASPDRSLLGARIPPAVARRLRADFAGEVGRARLHRGLLARLLTSIAGADAIVFGRRIYLGAKPAALVSSHAPEAASLLAHELAHVRQYRRAGAAIFLGRYVGEYLGRRLAGAPHARAYRDLSFEREAEEALRAFEKALEIGDRPAGS